MIFIISFLILHDNVFPLEFDLTGKIESKRKSNIVTILFIKQPDRNNYLIINNNLIVGKLKILSINKYTINKKIRYRALAEYYMKDGSSIILKAGTLIGLVKEDKKREKELTPSFSRYADRGFGVLNVLYVVDLFHRVLQSFKVV